MLQFFQIITTQQVIYSSYLSGLRFKQVSINFNIREHGRALLSWLSIQSLMQIVILMLTKSNEKLGIFSVFNLAITIFTSVTQLVVFNGVAPKPLMNVN